MPRTISTVAIAVMAFALPGHAVPRGGLLLTGFCPSPGAGLPLRSAVSPGAKAAKASKKGGQKKKSKGFTSGGKGLGGGKGGVGGEDVKQVLKQAITLRRKALRTNPYDPQGWLELGALLMKQGEYAEAERAFSAGVELCPGKEVLDAALMTLRGHSRLYYHGERSRPVEFQPSDHVFESFDVPEAEPGWVPDNDRHDAQFDRSRGRGLVHVCKTPVIPKEECAWAIQAAEEHALSTGGWTTARHASAPTTDMAIKDVPVLLDWFNEKLETVLFPMLASKFPEFIPSPDCIRVHDAFIVKYDASGQASLATHQDESSFSFTIALNDSDEYEGGGTYFENIRPTEASESQPFAPMALNADAGGIVCFGGKIRHGGQAISSGRRYIIPLFVYLDANKSGNQAGYSLDGFDTAM